MTVDARRLEPPQPLVVILEGLQNLPAGVSDVAVNVVWDPPWTPALMSEYGREQAGVSDR